MSRIFCIFAANMDNPFILIALIWRCKRPSRITQMKAIRNTFWLRKGYAALTFFGTVITATQTDADDFNLKDSQLKTHEMIHLRQAQSTHDSWLCFYILYIWYCLKALPLNRRLKNAGYRLNPFELEAYAHMYDADYLKRCQEGATEWKKWANMKPEIRLHIYCKNHNITI